MAIGSRAIAFQAIGGEFTMENEEVLLIFDLIYNQSGEKRE
jgi:hypothetical protein